MSWVKDGMLSQSQLSYIFLFTSLSNVMYPWVNPWIDPYPSVLVSILDPYPWVMYPCLSIHIQIHVSMDTREYGYGYEILYPWIIRADAY